MATLKEILQGLASQLSGTQGAVVVGSDGLALAEYSAAPSFKGEAVAAQLVMLAKLAERTAGQLGAGKAEDTQITTDRNYILVRPLGNTAFALGVLVDKSEGTLGMVRLVTGNHEAPLLEALPKRGK